MFYRMVRVLKEFWDEGNVNRLIVLVFMGLFVVGFTFSGYYYSDRYVHTGDKSPLELDVEHLEAMVRENPHDPEIRLILAQYYYDKGVYNKAIDQARQVLLSFPKHDLAMFILGLSYYQTGEIDESIRLLEGFTAIRQASPVAQSDLVLETALYFLGMSYILEENTEAAITVLSDALAINYTDADAMYQLGLVYAKIDQHEAAVQQFHNAIRFVPDFTEVFYAMAISYDALGQSAYLDYARGMEAFSISEYDVALTHLERSAVELSDFVPVHVGLGLVYEQIGEYQAAMVSLERALELEPENFMARNALGRIQLMFDG